jgi:hypothetical protein
MLTYHDFLLFSEVQPSQGWETARPSVDTINRDTIANWDQRAIMVSHPKTVLETQSFARPSCRPPGSLYIIIASHGLDLVLPLSLLQQPAAG